MQLPLTQISLPLQRFVSMQSAFATQQPGMEECAQPIVGTQVSWVQAAPSSQLRGVPGWQPRTG